MDQLDLLSINTIRTLSIDAIEKANSGHPGLPLGAAPMAYALWQFHLNHSPKNPTWANRDRFVLSAGHGSMLLYSLLHLTGYELSLDEIKKFRQLHSLTPGHPEFGLTPGVETTTGPLGQGAANAVGMAIAERKLANLFNKPGFELINHFTFALVSDGDLMEGVCKEAVSLAGNLKLGKLIYLYDSNDITLDGPTSLTFAHEDIAQRFESQGWHVQTVKNGDTDLKSIDQAITKAKTHTTQPSLIIIKTTIGFGSPIAGTSDVHGSPLNKEQILKTKQSLGWPSQEPFFIPSDAHAHLHRAVEKGQKLVTNWNQLFLKYQSAHPELAKQFTIAHAQQLPNNWDQGCPEFKVGESVATRVSSGKILNAYAKNILWLLGGDADLSVSTKTLIENGGSFEGQEGTGRNIHYGVREHAMASIANGISYHGGVRPFVATFFCFFDYMKPAVRLAAMNHLPCIYVWTHDSIGLGEDGPTHQPIEHLAALRAIPNCLVLRPADAIETREAWKIALSQSRRPTALVLTRQNVPTLDRSHLPDAVSQIHKGAYILKEATGGNPKAILIATGSEVSLALSAAKELETSGTPCRVVSFICWELFLEQDSSYRQTVLPDTVRAKVSIEAGSTMGWHRWVGEKGICLGLDRFGASAPAPVLYEEFGLTSSALVKAVKSLV